MRKGPKLGIIAGGGVAPLELMDACNRLGRSYFVICLEGQADAHLAENVPHAWIPLGGGEKLKNLVNEQGIEEIVMVGRVRRPSLTELKPDWLALKALTKIGLHLWGDDALLRGVGKVMEEETGARVIGVQEVFSDILMPRGVLGRVRPDEQAEQDIKRGVDVVTCLGEADVGQAVVVQQGLVLGVEAIEGTDALIARTSGLKRDGIGGVLVKMAKPQQDNRFDLPTIGVDTIYSCKAAGLRGIALQAERSLCLERDKVITTADTSGIFVIGITIPYSGT